MNRYITATLISTVLFLTACSPSLVVNATPNTSAQIAFSTNLSPLGLSLIRRFLGGGNSANTESISLYNKEDVFSSLEKAGISIQTLDTPGGKDLVFTGKAARLDSMSGGIFTAEKAQMMINLSPKSINAVINQLPPETADLLDLLMAPVFTGEELSRAEYLEIIAAAYGDTVAESIAESVCTICITVPAEIISAKVSSGANTRIQVIHTGKIATISIPLDLLLTLTDTTTISIDWKEN